MCDIQHCFICCPSDSTVSEDAGIEPRTVKTTALAARRALTTRLDIIHGRSHPQGAQSYLTEYLQPPGRYVAVAMMNFWAYRNRKFRLLPESLFLFFPPKVSEFLHCKKSYFPVPSRDVKNQTLPGLESSSLSRAVQDLKFSGSRSVKTCRR
jgi:hypothetical protein